MWALRVVFVCLQPVLPDRLLTHVGVERSAPGQHLLHHHAYAEHVQFAADECILVECLGWLLEISPCALISVLELEIKVWRLRGLDFECFIFAFHHTQSPITYIYLPIF